MTRELVPRIGRPSDAIRAHDLAVDAARAQILARLTGIVGREQPLMVEVDRAADGVDEPYAAPAVFTIGTVGVAQSDAGPRRQSLDRRFEVETFHLADERDGVAPLPATKAVIESLFDVDRERRRLVVVRRKRALALHTPADPFELRVL